MIDAEELYEERAGIAEYDGGLSRADAEAQADEYRHRCEVRWLCANQERGREYLRTVAVKRGAQAAQRLRDDALEQWQRGNRGKAGEWIG